MNEKAKSPEEIIKHNKESMLELIETIGQLMEALNIQREMVSHIHEEMPNDIPIVIPFIQHMINAQLSIQKMLEKHMGVYQDGHYMFKFIKENVDPSIVAEFANRNSHAG